MSAMNRENSLAEQKGHLPWYVMEFSISFPMDMGGTEYDLQ